MGHNFTDLSRPALDQTVRALTELVKDTPVQKQTTCRQTSKLWGDLATFRDYSEIPLNFFTNKKVDLLTDIQRYTQIKERTLPQSDQLEIEWST